MANISFHINKSKVNKAGFSDIRAYTTVNYKSVTKKITQCRPKHWNAKRQRINKPRPDEDDNNYIEINQQLEDFKKEAEDYFRQMKLSGQDLTPFGVKRFFNTMTVQKEIIPFWDAWDEYLEAGKLTKQEKTIKDQRTTKRYFQRFEKYQNSEITFEKIDSIFYDDFQHFAIIINENHYNYFATLIRRLKSFMNWSLKRGYHKNTEFKKFNAREKFGSIVRLTPAELKQFMDFKFNSERLEKVRDIFVFGCLTGLRVGDLLRLTQNNIKDEKIVTYMQKVRREKPLEIDLLPPAKKIIQKYRGGKYILPRISQQKFNAYIKEAAKEAGLTETIIMMEFPDGKGIEKTTTKDKEIHAHMTRKTFVSIAWEAGYSKSEIMEVTGIKNEKTLERYLA